MAKYSKRPFRLGDYWLGQRSDSPAWYRCWIEEGRTKRVSLNTTDEVEAKEAMTAWFYENRRLAADHIPPEKMPLVDVLDDYLNNHAKTLASYKSRIILIRYWKEFWKDAMVAGVRDRTKQDAFCKFMREKGLSDGSIRGILQCGKASINRAWKRGIISHAPFVAMIDYANETPKGMPLTLDQLRAFWRGSEEPHWHDLLTILIGTACRPGAGRELTKEQIDFGTGLVALNPPGRKQTSKYRPVVRLPETMRERFKDHPPGQLVRWRGEPVTKNERLFRAARDRAGLPKEVNLYSIRHTCGRWMSAQGVPHEMISQQLGHKRFVNPVTLVYAPLDPTYLKEACLSLDKLLQAVGRTDTVQATPETVENAA